MKKSKVRKIVAEIKGNYAGWKMLSAKIREQSDLAYKKGIKDGIEMAGRAIQSINKTKKVKV